MLKLSPTRQFPQESDGGQRRRLLWPRKRLDIAWSDFCYGGLRCFWPGGGRSKHIESSWSIDGHAIVCLSVRTGFDLLLQALRLPKGSEVLMSALNVPGMMRVVEENGLKPVPLDVDGDGLRPTIQAVRQAITPQARVLVTAHLFGARLNLAELNAQARQSGLLAVEDRAQAFDGVPFALPPQCDVAMHSFGAIKMATALGGAVLTVRDADLAARMRAIQRRYAKQPRRRYLLRLAKYSALKAISGRLPFSALAHALTWASMDYDAWLKKQARGFDDSPFLRQLRLRPCAPLTALLARRLRRFNFDRANDQRKRGLELAAQLGAKFPPAGKDAERHVFDLFPIRVGNPKRTLAALRSCGFDACTHGSMTTVKAPQDCPDLEPARAQRLLEEIVFLPLYLEMPQTEAERMSLVICENAEPVVDS